MKRILYFVIKKGFFNFCSVYYDFSDLYRIYNEKMFGYTTDRFRSMRYWCAQPKRRNHGETITLS